ncbi:MAG: Ldh family oxidoreductase [Candidatus Hodarchaeota archaeon]
MGNKTWYIPVEILHSFIKDTFIGLGVPEQDAQISADVLIESDLRGIESHGVGRLHYYYVRIKSGQHLTKTKIDVVREGKTTAVIDGNHGTGHVIAHRAMELAIKKAKEHGMGAVAVRNSTHFGIAGYYPLMAVKEGLIGLSVTNARPSIIPTFSVEPMLGTNPFAWGFPSDDDFPFVLDCATSIIQRGKVEMYERAGKNLDDGLIIDSNGKPMTEPTTILQEMVKGNAGLLPLGGAGEKFAGYKGYGFATVVEILSAAFSGANYLKDLNGLGEDGKKVHFRLGHFFMAIDPEEFMGLDAFKRVTGDIMRKLRAAKKAPGQDHVYVAGEKEYLAYQRVKKDGVPINKGLAEKLSLIKKELGLDGYRFPFENKKK